MINKIVSENRLLIMMNGLPLSGKTTLSHYLADELNLTYISTNVARDKMNLVDNLFDEVAKDRIYRAIIELALIDNNTYGQIVDATFNMQYRRQWLFDKIPDGTLFFIISCWVSEQESIRRNIVRSSLPTDVDTQGKTTYEYVKRMDEPVNTAEISGLREVTHIKVITEPKRVITKVIYNNQDITLVRQVQAIIRQFRCEN